MAEKSDIFEDLKSVVGCVYISDMRHEPFAGAARAAVFALRLEKYRLKQLEDLSEYLYGEKTEFASYETAKSFFGNDISIEESKEG